MNIYKQKLKTLIAITDIFLLELFQNSTELETLANISDIDYLPPVSENSQDSFEQIIPFYDCLLSSWGSPILTQTLLNKCSKLKFIGYAAGSVTSIVPSSLFESNDITLVNANHILARATAEGTIALMTIGSWRLLDFIALTKSGKWSQNNKDLVMGLSGKTIGIIGYGMISKEVIRLLAPYQPKILLCSNHYSKSVSDYEDITRVSLDQLLRESDIISFHQTLTNKTRNSIGLSELNLIRDGALLINTARGAIINEDALLSSLSEGRYSACLDVFHSEPLSIDSPILQLPNVICTPHMAAFSQHWKNQLASTVIADLIRWYNTESLHGKVTLEIYNRMTR